MLSALERVPTIHPLSTGESSRQGFAPAAAGRLIWYLIRLEFRINGLPSHKSIGRLAESTSDTGRVTPRDYRSDLVARQSPGMRRMSYTSRPAVTRRMAALL